MLMSSRERIQRTACHTMKWEMSPEGYTVSSVVYWWRLRMKEETHKTIGERTNLGAHWAAPHKLKISGIEIYSPIFKNAIICLVLVALTNVTSLKKWSWYKKPRILSSLSFLQSSVLHILWQRAKLNSCAEENKHRMRLKISCLLSIV